MPNEIQETNKKFENERSRPRFLSETIVLAVLPAYAYMLLFIYEQGFRKMFAIPAALIEVSPTSILKSIAYIVPFLFVILAVAEIFHVYRFSESLLAINILTTLFVVSFTIFIIYTVGDYRLPVIIMFSIMPLSIIYLDFIHPLMIGKNLKTYKMKLRRQVELDRQQELLVDKAIRKYGPRLFFIFLIGYLVLIFVGYVGSYNAKRQKSFLVLKGIPEMVVIRTYGQKLICCKFDRTKREIENKFVVKTMEQISLAEIQIQEEEIGPLKPIKE